MRAWQCFLIYSTSWDLRLTFTLIYPISQKSERASPWAWNIEETFVSAHSVPIILNISVANFIISNFIINFLTLNKHD